MHNKCKNYESEWFKRDHIKKDLKRKSLQSAVSKITANGLSFFLNVASTMMLARLLSPKEFGLLAMVTAVTELARSFRELGLGTLTVQREETNHDQVSTLFWINLIFAVILMLLLIFISPALAWFYGESKLSFICIALSFVFLFGGLSVQHRALLERQMKFGHLGVINLISNLAGYSVAIILALNGFGVWALVASEVISTCLYALGTWFCCRWIPSLPKMRKYVKSSLQFGSRLSAFDIIQYFSRNIDRILIGRVQGAKSLGLYTKAFQLAMMPIEQIRMIFWDIGLSPLSALQSEFGRFRSFYSKLLSIMAFVYMPIVVLTIIKPESIISLLLGENWKSGAAILRIIAIGGFFRPVLATLQLIMISYNRTKRYLKWGIVNGLMTISSFAVGIAWGTLGIAYAFAIANYIILFWSFHYCLKNTPINTALILSCIGIPLLASCGAGAILAVTTPSSIDTNSTFLYIASVVFIFVFAYAAILVCIPKSRKQLLEIWTYRKYLIAKA